MGANTVRSGWAALLASAAVLIPMAAIEANAGAFGLREQSTVGQGDAFAGVAAGGALSSMFWNPATMTQTTGFGIEGNGTGILSNVDQHPLAGSTLLPRGFGGAGDTGSPALLFSGYSTWQVSPNLWIGLSTNSPFGLSTSFPDSWAGRNYALGSSLMTYNATPSVALRINEWLSVGLGVQLQYGRADVNLGLTPIPPTHVNLNGSGWGFGLTAGVTVTPGPNTTIGVGWRSGIDQKIDGNLNFGLSEAANTTLNLPDIVSVGIRHRFDDRWTVMGTAEWTNWSRIGTAVVNYGPPPLLGPIALPFQFRDGWFCSRDMFIRDEAGFFVHQGRSDELLKVAGHWVRPGELEEAAALEADVAEAACVPVLDADGLQRLALFVTARGDATQAELAAAAACERALPRFKRPKWIRAIAELPRTATGKVQRFKLREMLEREFSRKD